MLQKNGRNGANRPFGPIGKPWVQHCSATCGASRLATAHALGGFMIIGVIYLIGREVYAAAYVKQPAKREIGYGLTFLPTVILVLGGLFGAVRQLLGH